MNELQTFSNALIGNIRVTMINGEPYFVGKDVADILGYKNTNDAISKRVDSEDKTDGVAIRDPMGREQHPILINESGLYSLIITSKKQEAKRFKHWITSEVLPAIRKHGVYATEEILNDPDVLIQALLELKEERAKRQAMETTIAAKDQQLLELKPKVSYYDIVLNCKDLIEITKIAKDFGWSGIRMNQYLHEKKIQYKTLMNTKPEYAVELAVKGMLPKNALGRAQLKKLRCYAGAEHGHEAQKPEVLKF